jgi:hypothetical protein
MAGAGQKRIMSGNVNDQTIDNDYAYWYSTASGHKFTRHLETPHIVFDRINDAAVSQEG